MNRIKNIVLNAAGILAIVLINLPHIAISVTLFHRVHLWAFLVMLFVPVIGDIMAIATLIQIESWWPLLWYAGSAVLWFACGLIGRDRPVKANRMPKESYLNWSAAPVRWHKFLIYFALPYSFVMTIVSISAKASAINQLRAAGLGWLGEWDVFLTILFGIATLFALVGLWRGHWRGVQALLFAYAFGAVYGVFELVSGIVVPLPTLLSNGTSLLISSGIFCVANLVYYKKRRTLFSPHLYVMSAAAQTATAHTAATKGEKPISWEIDSLMSVISEMEETLASAQAELDSTSDLAIMERLKAGDISGDEAKRQLDKLETNRKILAVIPCELEENKKELARLEEESRTKAAEIYSPVYPAHDAEMEQPATEPKEQTVPPADVVPPVVAIDPTKHGAPIWSVAVLGTVCVALAVAVGVFWWQATTVESQRAALTAQVTVLQEREHKLTEQLFQATLDKNANGAQREVAEEKMERMKTELKFWLDTGRIVIGENPYYHDHQCQNIAGADFLIYNVEAAKMRGYLPCPVCDPDSVISLYSIIAGRT